MWYLACTELHAAKRRLRELQAERDRERGRKVGAGKASAGVKGRFTAPPVSLCKSCTCWLNRLLITLLLLPLPWPQVLKLDEEGEELEAGSSSGSGEEGGRGTAHGRNRHHKKDDHDSRDGHRDERSSRDGKRGKKAGGGGDERGPEDLRVSALMAATCEFCRARRLQWMV
jgi:hypothetical protein